MSSTAPASIGFSFKGFFERGGSTADHCDGWGVAFFEEGGCRAFHDDQPASRSALAAFLKTYPNKARTVIAHLRRATQGSVTLANCHPFQREWLGQTWVFASNGDLQNFWPELSGSFLPVGTTDSERAFCFLMQHLRDAFRGRHRISDDSELIDAVVPMNAHIAGFGNFNYLLSNGDVTLAHCSSDLYILSRRHPFGSVKLTDVDFEADLGALNTPSDQMLIIATQPLTREEPWRPFVTGETKLLRHGLEIASIVNASTRRFPMPTLALRA